MNYRDKDDIIVVRGFINPCSSTVGGPSDQKEEKMNKYELALVLNAKIDDEERAATLERVKEYVSRFGGNIADVEEWGKRKLAYDIQKMHEGFYYFIHFESAADAPAQIEENVRIMDNVLRFLCVRLDEK